MLTSWSWPSSMASEVLDERGDIGGDEVFTLPHPDDQRGVAARRRPQCPTPCLSTATRVNAPRSRPQTPRTSARATSRDLLSQ